jgi:hypothetical protein
MLLSTFLLALAALSLPPAVSGAAPAPGQPAPGQEVSPQTIEDVEIMRRVLARALEEASGTDAPLVARMTPEAWVGRDDDEPVTAMSLLGGFRQESAASSALGFYLPGAGAFFALEVSLPMVEVAAPEAADEEDGADDLWSRTEREVRARPAAPVAPRETPLRPTAVYLGGLREGRQLALDPAAIRRVEDALLQQLARHGGKLELDPDEAITVAVRLRPGSRRLVELQDRPGDSVDWSAWLAAYGGGQSAERRLVVQVRAGDLGSTTDGSSSLQRLRERARIAQY